MPDLKLNLNGNVVVIIGSVAVGIVVLFIGVFMLSSIDPIFDGRVNECSYVNTAPSAATTLNATTASGSTTANVTFASATNVQGYCYLTLNITNDTATAGSYLTTLRADNESIQIGNTSIPATYVGQAYTTEITQSTGNWLANITAYGDDNITIPTGGSYLRCCSALVAQSGPAGQIYNSLVTTIATIFSIFGLILIIVGLAAAVGSLKNMF